jgi:hypothetical protein
MPALLTKEQMQLRFNNNLAATTATASTSTSTATTATPSSTSTASTSAAVVLKRKRLHWTTHDNTGEILETPSTLKLTTQLAKGATAQVSVQHGVLCVQTKRRVVRSKGSVQVYTQKSRYAVTNVVDTSRMKAVLDQHTNTLVITAPKLYSETRRIEIPVQLVHSYQLQGAVGNRAAGGGVGRESRTRKYR